MKMLLWRDCENEVDLFFWEIQSRVVGPDWKTDCVETYRPG